MLANQGFDVWVGNIRGNHYSTRKMSPTPRQFWDFSFDDMATYDLPGAFSYISRVTGKKIHYIGHSQGTMIMFIALSKQINVVKENLMSYHAFGPVAYLSHQGSKVMKALSKSDLSYILYVRYFSFRKVMQRRSWLKEKMEGL